MKERVQRSKETVQIYSTEDSLSSESRNCHHVVEYRPEVAEAAGQYEQVPDFMEAENAGNWIRFLQRIDECTTGITHPAKYNPHNAANWNR